jgi:ankyrin repeat protein
MNSWREVRLISNQFETLSAVLIRNGADTNTKDREDRTPLWYAVKSGSLTIVMILLQNRGDSIGNDQTSRELLFLATKSHNFAMLELLIGVVNMPRYGCYSQVRIAIQLDRYQKDSEGFGGCLVR